MFSGLLSLCSKPEKEVIITYNPAIPQPTNLISASQPQVLTNFAQLNTQFGVDHSPFYTGSGNGTGLHKKVTSPAQASVTASAGQGVYYTSMVGTLGGTTTQAVYKSGDVSPVSLLSAVKAWATCNTSGTRLDSFNVASVSLLATGNYRVTFTNPLSNANYAVLATTKMNSSFNTGGIIGYDVLTANGFQINIRSLTAASGATEPFSFAVIQS